MILRFAQLLSIAGVVVTAFSNPSGGTHANGNTALSSYLDSLDVSGGSSIRPSSYAPFGRSYKMPQEQHSQPKPAEEDQEPEIFPFASASYFATHNLRSKGPRPTYDWGSPADATRQLCDDGTFAAGAWFCTQGGWQSPSQKGATEIFYVLDGYGSLDDADGVRHYFGPGDNVIIPKGHTGRWDVNQDILKIWAVNDHEKIEENSSPIRVQVDHYNSWAPHFLTPTSDGNDPLYGPTSSSSVSLSKTFYDVGPTKVGIWSSEPGNYVVNDGKRAWIHVLEGVFIITNGNDGSARRCVAGDTIVLTAGWHGYVDVMETTKKLWTVAL